MHKFKLLNTEIYRDGGSIGINFQKDDLGIDEFELFLKIDSNGLNGVNEPNYTHVAIKSYHKCIYKCPMTGSEIPDLKITSKRILWTEALELFEKIEVSICLGNDLNANRLASIGSFIRSKCSIK